MDDRVFVKRGSRHGPDFFRHEAAGLAWLAAAFFGVYMLARATTLGLRVRGRAWMTAGA